MVFTVNSKEIRSYLGIGIYDLFFFFASMWRSNLLLIKNGYGRNRKIDHDLDIWDLMV